MVWNSGNSPLYRSVERFNNGSCAVPEPECEKCAPPPCPEPRKCSQRTGQQGLLQKLTSDRDCMLVVALIILLWHEKADMKLIAALAYILLG